jgi:hypothetical protein
MAYAGARVENGGTLFLGQHIASIFDLFARTGDP